MDVLLGRRRPLWTFIRSARQQVDELLPGAVAGFSPSPRSRPVDYAAASASSHWLTWWHGPPAGTAIRHAEPCDQQIGIALHQRPAAGAADRRHTPFADWRTHATRRDARQCRPARRPSAASAARAFAYASMVAQFSGSTSAASASLRASSFHRRAWSRACAHRLRRRHHDRCDFASALFLASADMKSA